jgi:hypothetical protein
MSDPRLEAIRAIIQEDVGNRGLATDPADNLITRTAGDLETACRSIADRTDAALAIVTGFFIPHGEPPCGETDGPLGAVFLARALAPLGIKVVLATDPFAFHALEIGLAMSGLRKTVPLVALPSVEQSGALSSSEYGQHFADRAGSITHLIALERCGPSHSPESLRAQPGFEETLLEQFLHEVPGDAHDRCHTMKGRDISGHMSPAQRLFEAAPRAGIATVGIGDGGNEIGMGKLPWDVIRRNIPGGGRVACRVPCDQLIVAGVSNWGAYGLAAGVLLLRGASPDPELFDIERERELLRQMVERGPLVDGVLGRQTVSVDGLEFERCAEPLRRLAALFR